MFRKHKSLIAEANPLSSVSAVVLVDDKKPFYTNLDTFSGKVVIKVRREIDVSEITLKLKADIITEVLFNHRERASFFASGTGSQRPDISLDPAMITDLPDFSQAASGPQYQHLPYYQLESSIDSRSSSFDSSRGDKTRREERSERRAEQRAQRREQKDRQQEERDLQGRDRSANDHERLYLEQVVLFPPEDVRASTSGKGFTLPAGEHEYSFKLQIPHKNHMYPGSLEGPPDTFKIVHALKVTVRRTSSFKMNTRVESPFKYVPFHQPGSLPQTGSVELYGEQLGPSGAVVLLGHLPSSQIETAFPGSIWKLPLTLKFDSHSAVNVLVLSIWLEACTARTGTDINSGKHHDKTVEAIPLMQIPINRTLSSADFSDMIQAKAIDKYVVASISQRVLDRVYFLRCNLTFMGAQGKQAVDLRDKITIVPPALSPPRPARHNEPTRAPTYEVGKVVPQNTNQSAGEESSFPSKPSGKEEPPRQPTNRPSKEDTPPPYIP